MSVKLKAADLQASLLAGPGQRQRWDEFVLAHPDGHLLQAFAWGDFKRRHSWPAVRVVVQEPESGRIVAGAQILFRSMAGMSIAYIPKGPLVNWQDEAQVQTLLTAIANTAKRRRSIYLKIEPNKADDPAFAALLTQRYKFRPSTETVQPRSTIRVDLTASPDAILARMKPKTRYNIRLAEKRGVKCRIADPNTAADFAKFYELMQTTGVRDKFGIHSAEYYRDALTSFQAGAGTSGGDAALWLAEFDGKLIAAVMVFAFGGEAAYLYGASSDEHRREMPTYLLQWQAMQWAKSRGARFYDFWGIPDDIESVEEGHEDSEQKNVRDGLWGVYRFKQGFGGEVMRYAGAFDYVYNRPLYLLWQRLQRRRAV